MARQVQKASLLMRRMSKSSVVVSAFEAHSGCAAAGDRLVGMMKKNGAAGFVTDGPVREYQGIAPVGLPVWCTGLTPASPHMSGPGSVGFPIQIGGQEVENGVPIWYVQGRSTKGNRLDSWLWIQCPTRW